MVTLAVKGISGNKYFILSYISRINTLLYHYMDVIFKFLTLFFNAQIPDKILVPYILDVNIVRLLILSFS